MRWSCPDFAIVEPSAPQGPLPADGLQDGVSRTLTAVSAGAGITRVDFGKSNSSRTLREPAHDRTPSRLAVSDDGLYLATLDYGTVEVIDLPAGNHKWTFQRYDGAGLDIRGPRVFSVHDDSRSIAAVVHGLDGRLLGELRLYDVLDDPSPFAVSGAGDAVAFVDKQGNLMVRDLAFARCPQKQR